jgi:3-oxoacyl-[acyl-carrier protein] reductase
MKKPDSVIITGASKGIGKAMATRFARKGYHVIINYHESKNAAEELYSKLRQNNFSVELSRANVAKREEVDLMVDLCVKKFAGVDILINNAGISQSKLFTDITAEDWDDMFNINLKGVFNCSQSVLRYMLPQKKGKIINISSVWGMVGASCEVHYSAAKAGVIGFTKALAKELGPSNIQVNCIAPGVVETGMMGSYSMEELNDLKNSIPLMRLGRSEEIAACALFLASQDADYITGQVISPNGGFVI